MGAWDANNLAGGTDGIEWLLEAIDLVGLPTHPLPVLFYSWLHAPPFRISSYDRASEGGVDMSMLSDIYEHTMVWLLTDGYAIQDGLAPGTQSIWEVAAGERGLAPAPGFADDPTAMDIAASDGGPPFWVHGFLTTPKLRYTSLTDPGYQ